MNKQKANYHTHTTFCDGSDMAEAVVQEALQKGFTHLGFSGHMDPGVTMDYAAYAQEISRLQAAYRDRIDILRGVELDNVYAPNCVAGAEYTIGSTHFVPVPGSPVWSTPAAVKEKMPAVADAAHYVASAQIRRKGTMVGNICNASPSADTAPILLAMNAKVEVQNESEKREIAIADFFKGVKKTNLVPGDIVTGIVIPELKQGEGSAYLKHAVRKAMDLAIVGVGCWIRMDGKTVADCRITMGGVGITPLRAKNAEQLLIGHEITDELLEQVGVAASQECSPISDVRASAEYRVDMIRVYTKRSIRKAVESIA